MDATAPTLMSPWLGYRAECRPIGAIVSQARAREAGKAEEAERIHRLGQLFLSFVVDDFARATQLEGKTSGVSVH